MQIHYGIEDSKGIKNAVVTTGSFDGVHIGHKAILNRINQLAQELNGQSVLITFYPHPRKVLYPDTTGKELMFISSQREKIELLSKAGLDHLIILNFTLAFSKISSEQFVRDILVSKVGAKFIVVGFNHYFGHNRLGDFNYLYKLSQELGFGVEEIPEQDIRNETVSSTTIRKAIKEGRIQRANAYLDHQYIIIGSLGRGNELFNEINYPTVNIQIEEQGKLVPPDGIYAVVIQCKSKQYRGLGIVWHEPNDEFPCIDLHIPDFKEEEVGQEATVYFHREITQGLDITDPISLSKNIKGGKLFLEELIY